MPARKLLLVVIFALPIAATLVPPVRREIVARLSHATVADRLREVESRVRPLWEQRLGTDPASLERITILAIKDAKELIVYGRLAGTDRRLASFPILAASGTPGPKLREGDKQVPEGFYGVSFLNPNSRFRLSLRVDYPNAEDRAAAHEDGRPIDTLGGDIMIHGGAASIGCIAIGDPAIEELFWLVATHPLERTEILITPSRTPTDSLPASTPRWLHDRYAKLAARIAELP